MHKYFVLNTAGGECRELRSFIRLKALDGLDEADRADRDQVLEIFTCIVEFFDIVNTTRCNFIQ
jgi:hypothetical protein